MKKKLLLLITLLLSLFIYSEKANAIVMWMQCTDTANGEMYFNPKVGNDETQFARYNTFAVINSYDSIGTSIRHVLYYGGQNEKGRSINFFEDEGPTFIMNVEERSSAYDEKVCWYQKEGAGDGKIGKDSNGDDLTQCDEDDENANPLIDVLNLNDGICPISVYQTTGSFLDNGTSGATKGDFVVMTGSKKTVISNKEELNGYKLVMYKAKTVYDENEYWIIEVYNDYGNYGVLFGMTPETAAFYSAPNVPELQKDNLKEFKKGDLHDFYPRILGIDIRGNTSSKIIIPSNSDYYHYDVDSEYVDFIQATQLLRLYYTGRNYFKLTKYHDYPEVLIANIGGNKDNNIHRVLNDNIYSYENGMEAWDKVKDWKNLVSESITKQSELLLNFSDGGKYDGLLSEAKNVSESVAKGKKYDLSLNSNGKLENVDDLISNLNDAYNELKIILETKFGYPTYKAVSREYWTSNGGVENKLICEQDGYTDDAPYSLSDYVSCQILGVPIDYATNNYLGKNTSTVINTFELAMSDQIKKLTGNNSSLLDVKGTLKGYIIDLSKYVSYINKNYTDNLSESQKKELEEILNKYLDMARKEFQIEIVIDCDTLLGEDFLNKIEKYVNIIKIAIPIILIGFGIYDFVSAIFAGDEDKMKKAQKKFIMRIVISILFFLLPFIIKLILTIANRAWSFISPSSCNFM